MRAMRAISNVLLLGAALSTTVSAFSMPTSRSQISSSFSRSTTLPFKTTNPLHHKENNRLSKTSLQMGYNLPPTPPEPKGPIDTIKDIIPAVLTIIGLGAFFASPLGGIFFAITNSLLALAFITPFVAIIGFQLWQTFYTLDGQCPNCGAPVKVLKDDDAEPNICLSCGSMVRANIDKDGIELCNDPNSIFDNGGGSIFDSLFGGGGGNGGLGGLGGNVFRDDETEVFSSTTTTSTTTTKNNKGKGTVIDVDVEED